MNEQRVIGIIANNPDQFVIARDLVNEYDFTDKHAQACWLAMEKLHAKHIPTAAVYLIKELDEYTAEWLDTVRDQVYGNDVMPFCKSMLADKRRDDLMLAIHQAPYEDDPAEYLEAAINRFRDVNAGKSQTFRELITKTVDRIEQISEGGSGIMTGFHCIDRQTGGLQNKRVMVIAARTAVGKTALTNQIALSMAKNGVPVGVCSLEMGDDELGFRAIAHATKASLGGLYRAEDYALEDMSKGMTVTKLADWPLHFNVDEYRLNEISNQIRLWVKRDGVKVAVVDHIGLVEVPAATSANERLGVVTRQLKKLSKDLDIPIIAVSQLNRGNEKENRRPRLSDLRDSGSIEQDADMVLLMHKLVDEHGDYICHDFNMAKNRQGPTGPLAARITFDGITQTFSEEQTEYYS
jgi:replicative DNA helicase